MILFPQPREITVSEGVFDLPMQESYGDLVGFFKLVKKGAPGISVISAPMLEKKNTFSAWAKKALPFPHPRTRACSGRLPPCCR